MDKKKMKKKPEEVKAQIVEEIKQDIPAPEIVQTRKTRKVAIVGTADTHKLAPYNDPEFEIWGVNNGYMLMPRYTRWFELHNITFDGKDFSRRANKVFRGTNMNDYMAGLAKLNVPVYMQGHWPQVPQSVPYPLPQILQYFGSVMGWFNAPYPAGRPPQFDAYFTNTISYMIALAIFEGFEEIHVYGVDMAVDSEYHWQRPSCEFFIGWAIGRGIKVYLPPQCDLMKTRFLYAFGEPLQDQFNMKVDNTIASLSQRAQKAQQDREIADAKFNQYQGAIMAAKEIKKQWA